AAAHAPGVDVDGGGASLLTFITIGGQRPRRERQGCVLIGTAAAVQAGLDQHPRSLISRLRRENRRTPSADARAGCSFPASGDGSPWQDALLAGCDIHQLPV